MDRIIKAKQPYIHPCVGFWMRFFAYIIDYIVLLAPYYLIQLFQGTPYDTFADSFAPVIDCMIQDCDKQPDQFAPIMMEQLKWVFGFADWSEKQWIIWFLMWMVYCSLLEGSKWQATIGKMTVGIKVVDEEGNRISYFNSIGRYISKYFSIFTLGIGFLMVGWTQRKQGLHDIIARTYVVYPKRLSSSSSSD